jgi:hypothetical protein
MPGLAVIRAGRFCGGFLPDLVKLDKNLFILERIATKMRKKDKKWSKKVRKFRES